MSRVSGDKPLYFVSSHFPSPTTKWMKFREAKEGVTVGKSREQQEKASPAISCRAGFLLWDAAGGFIETMMGGKDADIIPDYSVPGT